MCSVRCRCDGPRVSACPDSAKRILRKRAQARAGAVDNLIPCGVTLFTAVPGVAVFLVHVGFLVI